MPTACTSRCSARAASSSPATTACRCPTRPASQARRAAASATRRCATTPVRVAYMWVALPGAAERHGAMLVQVAETLDKRSRLANEIIKGVILPQFVILPLAVVLVWFALSRGIKPLSRLQQRIRKRESTDLSPIDERDVPDEVAPLVRAINELLARLDQSIRTQKQFLADAAHQLKTPLAGLRMQAELAEREIDAGASDAGSLKNSLQQIARSSQRAAHMVNQLLAMARAEDREQALRKQDAQPGRHRHGDGARLRAQGHGQAHRPGLRRPGRRRAACACTASRCCCARWCATWSTTRCSTRPRGGTVTARVVADPFGQVVVLQVEDNGPGIAEAERELVFQPFYRRARHRGRRQRPGPGHRARGRRPARRRDLGGRRAAARRRRGQRHRAGHADHGALSGAVPRASPARSSAAASQAPQRRVVGRGQAVGTGRGESGRGRLRPARAAAPACARHGQRQRRVLGQQGHVRLHAPGRRPVHGAAGRCRSSSGRWTVRSPPAWPPGPGPSALRPAPAPRRRRPG